MRYPIVFLCAVFSLIHLMTAAYAGAQDIGQAWQKYDAGNYEEAVRIFKEASLSPKTALEAKLGLAYSYLKLGERGKALPLLEELADSNYRPKDILPLLIGIYENKGQTAKAFDIAGIVSRTDEPGLKKKAGDYFFRSGCPQKAAEAYRGEDACYYNADKPETEMSLDVHFKSGDRGFSRLLDASTGIALRYPFSSGNRFSITLTGRRLSSGEAPIQPFAGSFFKNIPAENSLITSMRIAEPEMAFEKEGIVRFSLHAGLSPLGGSIHPLPTFRGEVMQKNWRLNMHQSPVRESMLSYIGLKDPYGEGLWGRVVKTGIEGEYIITPYENYWISLKAGHDFLRGKNVFKNDSSYAGIASGRTDETKVMRLTYGAYLHLMKFDHNTNFFTFGHGGYFSPQRFLSAGPLLRVQSRQCGSLFLDGQLSLSYIYYRTDRARQYPLETSGAQAALEFEGDSFKGIGYNAQLEALKLFSKHLAGGVSVKLNRSANYTELSSGVFVQYYFSPRSALFGRK